MIEPLWVERTADFALVMLVAAASFFDLRERRIPNLLVFPAALLGLGFNLARGWDGLTFGLKGLAVGFALLFVPHLFGAMGAGDVKLLAAIGAFVGAVDVTRVLLATVLCYPLMAAVIVIRERKVKVTLLRFRRVFFNFLGYFAPSFKLYAARIEGRDDPSVESATTPFGLAIAAGTLVALFTDFAR